MKANKQIEKSKLCIRNLRTKLESLRKERALCRCATIEFMEERNFGLAKTARKKTSEADETIRSHKKQLSREMAFLTALKEAKEGRAWKKEHDRILNDMAHLAAATKMLLAAAYNGGTFRTDSGKHLLSNDNVQWKKKNYTLFHSMDSGKWMIRPEGKGEAVEAPRDLVFVSRAKDAENHHTDFLEEAEKIQQKYRFIE